ncbi:M91 family zinc metallopeptidase [Cystobacter fuscus]|nr:M91 family zinc metallopeptidase [Cystobacter fuscus]
MKVNRPNVSTPPSPTASTARSAPTSPTAPTSPSAPTQRTQATGPTAPPPVTDSLSTTMRPSAGAGGVNLAGTTAPPPAPPPPPRSATTAAPGQPPRNVNASLEDELKRGRESLKKTDHGVVHPDLPGIRTRRDNLPAHEFADHTRDSRASIHTLMANNPNGTQSVGNKMLTDINGSTAKLNNGSLGTAQNPATAVDIHAGNKMTHAPRLEFDTVALGNDLGALRPNDKAGQAQVIEKHQQMAFMKQGQAYRAGGQPGPGQASTVTYNANQASSPQNRAKDMGHEMVHAHRASNGMQVGSVEHGNLKHHPAFQDAEAAKPGGAAQLKADVNFHAQLKEEFETVGMQPTPGRPNAPTENKIRQQLGMQQRTDYSGHTPATSAYDLKEMKQPPDTRTAWQKVSGKPIPGADQRAQDVQQIVNHLEK